MTKTLEPQGFLREMESHLSASGLSEDSFLTRFKSQKLSHQQLTAFAIQWYKTARAHKQAFPALIANVRDDDVRFELIDILREEYGNGDREKIHARLLEKFLQALGVSQDEVQAAPTLVEVREFSNTVARVWGDEGEDEAAAFGLHFALEYLAATLHKSLAQGLEQYPELSESDREYFEYHRVAEERHADYSRLGLLRYAAVADRQPKLRTGIDCGIRLMGSLYRGYETYVFAG